MIQCENSRNQSHWGTILPAGPRARPDIRTGAESIKEPGLNTQREIWRVRPTALLAGFSLLLMTATSSGQSDTEALEALRECAVIENDAERLACLDSAIGIESASEQEGEVDINEVDSDEVDPDQEVHESERQIRVVDIERTALGSTTFTADDGQVWVQRSGSFGRYPDVPFDAVLSPAMGDSYFLISPLGGRPVRVTSAR